MLGRTNTGGGGGVGGLNFQVIGGTTAPSNPKENTIWVNTDVKITSWIFSATEPATPEEGMVWITTGAASAVEFNSLKKNGIQVYPLSAKQYVAGNWVTKTAKTYRDGAWVDWMVAVVYSQAEGVASSQATSGNRFTFKTVYSGTYGGLASIEKIPLGSFKTIRLEGTVQLSKSISVSGQNFFMKAYMVTSDNRTVNNGAIMSTSANFNHASTGLQAISLTLDIPGETMDRYVKFWVVTNTSITDAVVTVNITKWEVLP